MTFQEIILNLQQFWADYGCLIHQPCDIEVGAGTFNPARFLRCLGPEPWNVAYVEPSRRPTDGRYGENPYRLGAYYQYQVILKPAPTDVLPLYLESLKPARCRQIGEGQNSLFILGFDTSGSNFGLGINFFIS